MKSEWHVGVGSDVYAGPVGEDGHPSEELCFFVSLEGPTGVRYISRTSWTTERFGHNSNGLAAAHAAHHAAKVEAALAHGASPVGSAKWVLGRPVYGSAAYDPRADLEDEARDLDAEAGSTEGDRFRRAVGIDR